MYCMLVLQRCTCIAVWRHAWAQGVQGISDIITIPGLVNVDFADVKAIMCNSGTAMLGVGVSSGKSRAEEAAMVCPQPSTLNPQAYTLNLWVASPRHVAVISTQLMIILHHPDCWAVSVLGCFWLCGFYNVGPSLALHRVYLSMGTKNGTEYDGLYLFLSRISKKTAGAGIMHSSRSCEDQACMWLPPGLLNYCMTQRWC